MKHNILYDFYTMTTYYLVYYMCKFEDIWDPR